MFSKFEMEINQQTMYNLFITHTPNGVCYLVAKDMDGNIIYKMSITQTSFFDLREKAIPEILND